MRIDTDDNSIEYKLTVEGKKNDEPIANFLVVDPKNDEFVFMGVDESSSSN